MGEPHTLQTFVSLILRPVSPLHGGGFLVAFAQICTFYYVAACALHFVLPSLVKLDSIQPRARKQGEARRDAFYSIGENVQPVCRHLHVPVRGRPYTAGGRCFGQWGLRRQNHAIRLCTYTSRPAMSELSTPRQCFANRVLHKTVLAFVHLECLFPQSRKPLYQGLSISLFHVCSSLFCECQGHRLRMASGNTALISILHMVSASTVPACGASVQRKPCHDLTQQQVWTATFL